MYAFVEGEIDSLGPPVVVSVAGLGYEVWVPERHRRELAAHVGPVRLYTHLQVREDDMTLYGFPSPAQREIFRALISVNGVGPKVALAVLGDESADEVLLGIRRGDHKPLQSVKGIGKKTAERIVIDLQERASAWVDGGTAPEPEPEVPGEVDDPLAAEALLALQALGVPPDRASAAIVAALHGDERPDDVEALLRQALRRLHPAG